MNELSMGQKIWKMLFPKPKWVVECEAALEADRAARQRLYDYWDWFDSQPKNSIPNWPR